MAQARYLRELEIRMTRVTSNMCIEIREIAHHVDLMIAELQPTPEKKDPPQPPRSESPFLCPQNLPIPSRGPRRTKSSVYIATVVYHLSHVLYSLINSQKPRVNESE